MMKNQEDLSKQISNMKIYMAIMAIVIVVMGIYMVAGAVGFAGMKWNVGGKAYAITSGTTPGAIYVDSASNVGIGTSAPLSKLHVSGNTPQIRVSDSGTGGKSVALMTGTVYSALASTGDLSINTGSNLGSTPSGEAIRVTSDGKVGIGTNSPQSKLDVNGNINTYYNIRSTDLNTSRLYLEDSSFTNVLQAGFLSINVPNNPLNVNKGQIIFLAASDAGGYPSVLFGDKTRIKMLNLTGSGNDYLCVDPNGLVFRSNNPC